MSDVLKAIKCLRETNLALTKVRSTQKKSRKNKIPKKIINKLALIILVSNGTIKKYNKNYFPHSFN